MTEKGNQLQKGDVFQAKEDILLHYMTHWRKPYTGGGKATIPKGTKIEVTDNQANETNLVSIYCLPIRERKIEKLIIPKEDRKSFKYDGYHLLVEKSQLESQFEFIGNDENKLSLFQRFFKKLKAWF